MSATDSATFLKTSTASGSATVGLSVVGTGTGTTVFYIGSGTLPVTATLTAGDTKTFTFTGTGSGSATASASGTITGTTTDTSRSYGTATSATVASNPTIIYNAPLTLNPGGDRWLAHAKSSGGALAAVWSDAPWTDPDGAGEYDLMALPTVGSPMVFSQEGFSCTGADFSCPVMNNSVGGDTSTQKWVTEGTVQIWAWVNSTSEASIYFVFDTCTGGYLTGEGAAQGLTTVVFTISSSGWSRLYATMPLPNGLLLKPNYQLCVKMSAYTSSGAPTVMLGASAGHYSRINGPWR
jgi:hypothetical protein